MKKLLALTLAVAMLLSIGAVVAAEEQITAEITWWAFPTFAQKNAEDLPGTYEQTLVDAFQAKYPGIKVKLETIDFTTGPEKITTAIEGNTQPDVLFDAPGRIVDFGKKGKLVPLNDLFTDELKADVNEAIIGACGDGTNYWMYPLSTAPFFMVINKEHFEEADALQYVNLEGDRSWTTENFVKAVEALKAAGKTPGNIFCKNQGCDQGTRALVANLYSAKFTDEAMTRYTIVESEEGKKGLELLKGLVDKGALDVGPDMTGGDEIKLFTEEVLSMAFCWGSSAAKANAAKMNFTALSLPFPSDDGQPELEYLVNGFCVFDKGDENRAKASKLFIQFLCDSEEVGKANVLATGAFPVRASYGNLYEGNAEYELLASFTKHYAPYYNTMNRFTEMRVQWWTMLQAYLTGAKTLEEATNIYTTESNAGL